MLYGVGKSVRCEYLHGLDRTTTFCIGRRAASVLLYMAMAHVCSFSFGQRIQECALQSNCLFFMGQWWKVYGARKSTPNTTPPTHSNCIPWERNSFWFHALSLSLFPLNKCSFSWKMKQTFSWDELTWNFLNTKIEIQCDIPAYWYMNCTTHATFLNFYIENWRVSRSYVPLVRSECASVAYGLRFCETKNCGNSCDFAISYVNYMN